MNLQVPVKAENFLTIWAANSFSWRICSLLSSCILLLRDVTFRLRMRFKKNLYFCSRRKSFVDCCYSCLLLWLMPVLCTLCVAVHPRVRRGIKFSVSACIYSMAFRSHAVFHSTDIQGFVGSTDLLRRYSSISKWVTLSLFTYNNNFESV
jgi:hypothetical protein